MNESIKLSFTEGASDKVYNAELKERSLGWIVNFEYGRRGNALVAGTKTKTPVKYESAKKAYDKLVDSKLAKGYKSSGQAVNINTAHRADSGIRPQLLNEVEEASVTAFIDNPDYCMQEKFDGRRKMIKINKDQFIGINKKGFVVGLTDDYVTECKLLDGGHILDGEDMGHVFMVFDDVQNPQESYFKRHTKLAKLLSESLCFNVVKTAWAREAKRTLFENLKTLNAEGVVFKKISSLVKPGRPASGGDQFKFKFYATASCIVQSISDVKSSISLSVINEDGIRMDVGNVTVYPNQDTPPVGAVVEIKYLYYYPGGSLYQPVLLGVRDDVDQNECFASQLKEKPATADV